MEYRRGKPSPDCDPCGFSATPSRFGGINYSSSNNNLILTLCLAFHYREREMMPAGSGGGLLQTPYGVMSL